jgi:hypothetical protein
MKWIVVAILLFVVAYTALTLKFRKPGRAYEPYRDNKERATVTRLRSAGFRRITATADRPAEIQRSLSLGGQPATIAPMPGGLPPELKDTLIDPPNLPQTFTEVRASSEANQLMSYTVQFTCALPDNKQLLSGAYVYLKEDELAIVTDFEKIDGELLARTRETAVQLSVPAGAIPPGTYRVTLVGARESKQWTLQVH